MCSKVEKYSNFLLIIGLGTHLLLMTEEIITVNMSYFKIYSELAQLTSNFWQLFAFRKRFELY